MSNQQVKTIETIGYKKDEETKFYLMSLEESESIYILDRVSSKKVFYRCNYCRSEWELEKPLSTPQDKLKKNMGKDLIIFWNNLIGNDKFIRALEKHHILGYQLRETEILDNSHLMKSDGCLNVIEIKGRVKNIFNLKGEKIKACSVCGQVSMEEKFKTVKGIAVKNEDWDGTDIFKFQSERYIFVTNKFKSMIEEEGIKGVLFTPIDEGSFCSDKLRRHMNKLLKNPQQ